MRNRGLPKGARVLCSLVASSLADHSPLAYQRELEKIAANGRFDKQVRDSARIMAARAQKQNEPEWAKHVREFARSALHGDQVHQQWLLDAAENFIAGLPLPQVRSLAASQQTKA